MPLAGHLPSRRARKLSSRCAPGLLISEARGTRVRSRLAGARSFHVELKQIYPRPSLRARLNERENEDSDGKKACLLRSTFLGGTESAIGVCYEGP
jgi:hypothetical protein